MIKNQTQNQSKNVNYQSPPIGQEISCVMKGVDNSFLEDSGKLKEILTKILKENEFEILKTETHKFIPQGFTIFLLLAESHLAVHSYPEHESLYFSLYSCRGPNDAEKTFEEIKKILNPKELIYLNKKRVPIR